MRHQYLHSGTRLRGAGHPKCPLQESYTAWWQNDGAGILIVGFAFTSSFIYLFFFVETLRRAQNPKHLDFQ